jgi:hypothetical protein
MPNPQFTVEIEKIFVAWFVLTTDEHDDFDIQPTATDFPENPRNQRR